MAYTVPEKKKKGATDHPRGGGFDFEEFKDELKQNNIDIVNMKRIKDIAIFCVGRKR